MSVVSERLSQVVLGEQQVYENLTLYPLLAEGPSQPEYRLLDEALELGCARVTEVSDSGSVPELKFVNGCDRPVLLLDGEELVGAKQNRILNLTVLAPAGKTIEIPVSCVEAGRWRHESTEFRSAGRAHYAAGRARKAAQVSLAMRGQGVRRSDQSAVWEDISAKSARMEVRSETGAAAAMYETHRASLDDYRNAFCPVEGQTGAMFAVNGRIVGLDLFDSPATLSALLNKLVESYALDALDEAGREAASVGADEPQSFLSATSNADIESFPAVGEGEDLRLRGGRLSGGALVKDDRVVHLCVFRVPGGGETPDEHGRRLVRASMRRRARSRI
ncbi:MAG: DUF6569 family protein [Pseudomonadota bacterium]|nr:DUF6569 family protein [Pseudomonadota bacterium]